MVQCKMCGECCRYIVIEMEAIDFDKDWVIGRGGEIVGHFAKVPSQCYYLLENGKCSIWSRRPRYCRKWPKKDEAWVKQVLGCKYFE